MMHDIHAPSALFKTILGHVVLLYSPFLYVSLLLSDDIELNNWPHSAGRRHMESDDPAISVV